MPQAMPLPRHRLGLAWLLLALVLAPMLGRMHQLLHMPGGGVPQVLAHTHGAASPGAARHALDTLHALFSGHGNADCQVLDQQTLVGAALGQAPALQQEPPQQPPASMPAPVPGTRAAIPFHARAPPLSV